jgi:hypothetical protein
MNPQSPRPSRPRAPQDVRASAPSRGVVGVFERHEPIPPKVWALWIGCLAFVLLVAFLIAVRL